MKYLSLFLLILFSYNGISHDDDSKTRASVETFVFKDHTFPILIDLQKQFREEIPLQGESGTCSVFSSIALLEAACKRATGKEIDLSEAFTIYQVLKNSFGQGSQIYSLNDPQLYIRYADADHPRNLLRSLLKGNTCAEADLSLERDFIPFFTELKKELLKEFNAPELTHSDSEKIKSLLCKKMNLKIECSVPKLNTPEINLCLNKLAATPSIESNPSTLKILSLLNLQQPVLCVTQGNRHALVFMGARPGTKPSEIEWLARDSAKAKPYWISSSHLYGKCAEIISIPLKE